MPAQTPKGAVPQAKKGAGTRTRGKAERRAKRARVREKPKRIADEIRALIVSGKLCEGDLLGREAELVKRFGVSRPSLREALRILEAEGLISVVRGVLGGVVIHEPDERMTARAAASVLRARNVSLADVHAARSLLEPTAAGIVASRRSRRAAVSELRERIREQLQAIGDPDAFGPANARFHESLVALAGNQTLSILVEMLNEIVARAVTAVSRTGSAGTSLATRRRGLRSQERLVSLLEAGDAPAAEAHWRAHMTAVGRVLLGRHATHVVDLMDYR